MKNIDLDVDTPSKVSQTLRDAAERYRESAITLSAAWQDPKAGVIWMDLARIIERAAEQADRAIKLRRL